MLSRTRPPYLSRLAAALLVGLVTGALILSTGAAEARPAGHSARFAPSADLTVTGKGWGHGHGMAQWGAQGAAKKGLSASQILSFYYPHTTWGKAGGKIRALIVADTSRDVLVKARSGLTAQAVRSGKVFKVAKRKPKATRWRIKPVSGGRSALDFKTKGWHRFRTVKGDLQFSAGGKPIRLYLPHGRSADYRGVLRSASPKPGKMERNTVSVVSLDNYIRSVVPSEAFPSWKPAALQAQAVAARSYAVHQRSALHRGYFDVYDTVSDQVYRGTSVETASTDKAVTATKGRIRTYGGSAAFTQFSASNGGFALDGGKPYLVSKKDPYDAKASGDTNLSWSKKVGVRSLMDRFTHGKEITEITLAKVAGTGGRYVSSVRFDWSGGSNTVSGDVFKSWAGLKSTWFTIG